MFEKTEEELHAELLGNINDSYQKTIGYPAWDFTRAFAKSLLGLFSGLETIYQKFNVDNLEGLELEKWVYQRKGLSRKQASCATTLLSVVGTCEINEGDLFETEGGVQFEATEAKTITDNGTVNIKCLTAGDIGNVGANSITLLPETISGVISVNNDSPATGGYEAETDASLRERYYEALQAPITSGNIYHYKMWAKEITGVGDASVYPLEFGNNTVEIIIIDSNKEPADTALVAEVQNHIDPNSEGKGEGQAPIGAYCTVNSATGVNINVSCEIVLMPNYTLEQATANITEAIETYLKSIALTENYVSYAKIGNAILDSDGVSDYSNLTVNASTSNIAINPKEVAVIGTMGITESA